MFSNFTVGLLAGIGVGAWIYTKVARSTGGRTKDALIVAAVTGALVTTIVTYLLGAFF